MNTRDTNKELNKSYNYDNSSIIKLPENPIL